MLDFLGEDSAASRIVKACEASADAQGSTPQVADAVIARL
jgi:hypothetical protein